MPKWSAVILLVLPACGGPPPDSSDWGEMPLDAEAPLIAAGVLSFTASDSSTTQLFRPRSVAFGERGQMFVVDLGDRVVRVR